MKPDDIRALTEAARAELESATTADAVEAIRIKYLGRKGLLQEVMKGLRDAAPQDRPEIGRLANEFKTGIQSWVEAGKARVQASVRHTARPDFDGTRPGLWRGLGRRHPISLIIEETVAIFARLGFTVADGPDIETAYHNFDALNTPEDHPSRDPNDTFWLETGELLRTQTSPVQIRVMESCRPPIRIVAPGRCYRRDTTDATHSANFHQIEGLYVDEKVSMADLKSDISYFARRLMGPTVKVRFRPHFFPFTEPSVEYDFSCHLCAGAGCRVCKQSGWIEISGAGMVDPRVFTRLGYDPESVSGYAFGMGVERIAMIRYGITDIRMLYENDLRFLERLGA
jgi:phenylalanyl-tRNA synthetase alpha chain